MENPEEVDSCPLAAVLTGEVEGYSDLPETARAKMPSRLIGCMSMAEQMSRHIKRPESLAAAVPSQNQPSTRLNFQIIRPGVWQWALPEPMLALRYAVLMRLFLKGDEKLPLDTSVAIGVGTYDFFPDDAKAVSSPGDGEAFSLSWTGHERQKGLKKSPRLALSFGGRASKNGQLLSLSEVFENQWPAGEWNLHLGWVSRAIGEMSDQQAEATALFLSQPVVKIIAARTRTSEANASKLLKRAAARLVADTVERYEAGWFPKKTVPKGN